MVDFTGCQNLSSDSVKYLHSSKMIPNLKNVILDNTDVSLPCDENTKFN